MSYREEWRLYEASDQSDEFVHRPMTEEFLFYQAVSNGDIEAVKRNCEQERFMEKEGVGQLSRNQVTNMKYHFVIGTAMITRICCQNDMELELAFRLSDFYIQKLDDLHTVQEIQNLHDEMVIDFTEKMRQQKQKDVTSKHISACKDYIYCHIKERITVEQLALEYGVSTSYLSRLFKKEVGVSLSTYVRNKKIEVAKDLLKFSQDSMIDIANHLSFSSQSHFIQQFKEVVGMTPKKYRDSHHRVKWDKTVSSNSADMIGTN